MNRADVWVLLPLCRGRDQWLSAIAEAAAVAGLSFIDADRCEGIENGWGRLVVTAWANRAAGAVIDVVLAVAPGVDDAESDDALAELAIATEAFVRASSVLASTVLSAKDLIGSKVALVDNVQLVPPHLEKASTPQALAFQECVRIYEPTAPTAHWGGAIFVFDPRNTEAGRSGQPMDITGRPRFLISGPYFYMPVGRWRAVVTLVFDGHSSGIRYRLDWGGVDDYSSYEFVPPRPGVYDVTIEYSWASSCACEMRLLVLEGVFHGDIEFRGAAISKVRSD